MPKYASGGIVLGQIQPAHEGPHQWGQVDHVLRAVPDLDRPRLGDLFKPVGFGRLDVEVGTQHIRHCLIPRCWAVSGAGPCDHTAEQRSEIVREALAPKPPPGTW